MGDGSRWADVQRLEGWAGEVRVNLIRLAGIFLFYGNHLFVVYFSASDAMALQRYHAAVTAIVAVWSAQVVALHLCLSRRWAPWWLKYACTGADILLITTLLIIGGDPRSPLANLYFLVIAAAPLRLSLRLVQIATLSIMTVYAVFEMYASWSWRLQDALSEQIVFVLALGAAGLFAGQAVRQTHRILQGYPVTVADKKE